MFSLKITDKFLMTNMDKKFLKKKGLLEAAERFNYIMEYVTATDGTLAEVDANMDGLDDATGMADPAAAGGAAPMDPMAGGAMLAGHLLSPKTPRTPFQREAYECGNSTIGPTRVRFRVGYVFFALLFLVFDIETLLLFPAVSALSAANTCCVSP